MTNNLDVKKELYNQCADFIEKRLITIKGSISDIQEALDSETKNSTGDKHETGRAMLQIDLEKSGNQFRITSYNVCYTKLLRKPKKNYKQKNVHKYCSIN